MHQLIFALKSSCICWTHVLELHPLNFALDFRLTVFQIGHVKKHIKSRF